ncbi:hypothetical protein [Streptomyces sp. VRA16 Mangrove soil]|uniref:hypothetical protein n=1 Tax=Streptomyces sp. VRA16 Mangrove soil TaxID=2817434 RepID=UPI001A9FFC75|nr:hypothetical protein [Streptomyces sp. VRA16 Mangrove soil]MBO1337822.1 hypothetical protein [Streptomyces sp. VRA16 Mangrove soil]
MHPALALAPALLLLLPADGASAGEADLAHHGTVTMARGHVTVTLTPQNHGPTDVPDATLRLAWSAPLADAQDALPAACLRSGPRTVDCRTGALPAAALGTPLTVDVRLAGAPSEVTVRLDTVWSGGTADHNPQNNRHKVLVLDTGDTYYF